MELLASPGFAPFSTAALILAGLVAVELVTLLLGASASGAIDSAVGFEAGPPDAAMAEAAIPDGPSVGTDAFPFPHPEGIQGQGGNQAHHPGPLASAFDWLNAGRVPVLTLLMALLASFSAFGFLAQGLAAALVAPLPGMVAVVLAGFVAVPATRLASRSIGQLVPRDESYAVVDGDFIGAGVEVTVGPVRAGVVARGKLQDRRGNWHFPRLEPAEPGIEIAQGGSAVVVGCRGGVLLVIPAGTPTGQADRTSEPRK